MGAEVGLLAASAAGFLSFLSPCVLPLVPPYLCFVAGTSLDDLSDPNRQTQVARRTFVRALAFVLGFATVFVALGASASFVGQIIGEHLTLLTRIAGLVIIGLGLHMLGVFRSALLMRDTRVQLVRRPTSTVGAFVVGLAFAFGWTPCVGPVLASVLLLAGTGESASLGAGLLAAYAAGLGVPFLIAALFTGSFMRWVRGFRRHTAAAEKVMGAALVATGVIIFVGAMPLLAAWVLDVAPVLGRIG
jgi:cytochrome c-type biogenesis protein